MCDTVSLRGSTSSECEPDLASRAAPNCKRRERNTSPTSKERSLQTMSRRERNTSPTSKERSLQTMSHDSAAKLPNLNDRINDILTSRSVPSLKCETISPALNAEDLQTLNPRALNAQDLQTLNPRAEKRNVSPSSGDGDCVSCAKSDSCAKSEDGNESSPREAYGVNCAKSSDGKESSPRETYDSTISADISSLDDDKMRQYGNPLLTNGSMGSGTPDLRYRDCISTRRSHPTDSPTKRAIEGNSNVTARSVDAPNVTVRSIDAPNVTARSIDAPNGSDEHGNTNYSKPSNTDRSSSDSDSSNASSNCDDPAWGKNVGRHCSDSAFVNIRGVSLPRLVLPGNIRGPNFGVSRLVSSPPGSVSQGHSAILDSQTPSSYRSIFDPNKRPLPRSMSADLLSTRRLLDKPEETKQPGDQRTGDDMSQETTSAKPMLPSTQGMGEFLSCPMLPSTQGMGEFLSCPEFVANVQARKALKAARNLAMYLQSKGIQVVASDFDRTITKNHSGGHVPTQRKCAETMRVLCSLSKEFDAFGTACGELDLKIAVVTFSDSRAASMFDGRMGGSELVSAVLEYGKASFSVDAVYGFLPELYRSSGMYSLVGLEQPMPHSKSFHLDRLCKDFGVAKKEVVLIDDDINNCESAAREGYYALHVDSYEGFHFDSLRAIEREEPIETCSKRFKG
eukprot:GHVO01051447.1.p1 GENE.GHVO01051447.1~~GHVO01051447.1.p1  ORF type:complete len:679 (+),score=53.86 GHVO01051447.1:73-2109(+)